MTLSHTWVLRSHMSSIDAGMITNCNTTFTYIFHLFINIYKNITPLNPLGELLKSNPDRQTHHRTDQRFAEHLQEQYLIKLTSPGNVDLRPEDAATVKAHVARFKDDNINVSTDEGKDPDAEKHARAVKLATKKPPFNADQPAVAYDENGDWEDVQLHAAWAAEYDKERTVSFNTWLAIHNARRKRCQSCNKVLASGIRSQKTHSPLQDHTSQSNTPSIGRKQTPDRTFQQIRREPLIRGCHPFDNHRHPFQFCSIGWLAQRRCGEQLHGSARQHAGSSHRSQSG